MESKDEEREELDELKTIIGETLKEAGLTDAAGKINAPDRPTKEEILSIRSRTQRQKAIAENMDLFR